MIERTWCLIKVFKCRSILELNFICTVCHLRSDCEISCLNASMELDPLVQIYRSWIRLIHSAIGIFGKCGLMKFDVSVTPVLVRPGGRFLVFISLSLDMHTFSYCVTYSEVKYRGGGKDGGGGEVCIRCHRFVLAMGT